MSRVTGGIQASKKIKAKDPDFYKRIGAMGGRAKVPKGFALMDKDRRKACGFKGGTISRRTK